MTLFCNLFIERPSYLCIRLYGIVLYCTSIVLMLDLFVMFFDLSMCVLLEVMKLLVVALGVVVT